MKKSVAFVVGVAAALVGSAVQATTLNEADVAGREYSQNFRSPTVVAYGVDSITGVGGVASDDYFVFTGLPSGAQDIVFSFSAPEGYGNSYSAGGVVLFDNAPFDYGWDGERLSTQIQVDHGKPTQTVTLSLAGIADDMIAEAESGIHKVLGARADNGWMYASAFQWFREVGTDAIGLKNISEAVREDLTLAQAVFNGPRQIMGFGKDTHMTMREGIAKKWVRDEWAQLNEGLDVQKSLSNYMPLIGDIHGAYYNPAVIEQSDASRVDV